LQDGCDKAQRPGDKLLYLVTELSGVDLQHRMLEDITGSLKMDFGGMLLGTVSGPGPPMR
jgi:hypothetical protein